MSTCRGCGKKIIWGTTKDGKRIPLDPAPPVYSVIGLEYPNDDSPTKDAEVEIVRIQRAPTLEKSGPETAIRERGEPVGPWLMASYVSHFATCPQANQFSAKKVST